MHQLQFFFHLIAYTIPIIELSNYFGCVRLFISITPFISPFFCPHDHLVGSLLFTAKRLKGTFLDIAVLSSEKT